MKLPLTPKQQGLYAEIKGYFSKHDQSPTLEELRAFLKVGSINAVVQHLSALEKKGYILRRKNSKRNIELRDTTNDGGQILSIPVVASVGCDDLSVFANQQHDEFIQVDKKVFGNRKNIVAVRAVGRSMNDAGINDGDYVLAELTDHAENGEKVIVNIGDMITIKRIERENSFVILRPVSTDTGYKPMVMNEEFKVSGKVIAVIPSESRDITEVVPL